MLDKLKRRLQIDTSDNSLDDYLNDLLEEANLITLNEYYGSNQVTETSKLPYRFKYIPLDVAVFLFNKTGVEGQTGHTEQGINRQYGTSGVPTELFASMVRKIRTFDL